MPGKPQQKRGRKGKAKPTPSQLANATKQRHQAQAAKVAKRIQNLGVLSGVHPEVKTLAIAMANPTTCPNLRWKIPASSNLPTAVSPLHYFHDYNNSYVSGDSLAVSGGGHSLVALFRNPARAVIQFFPNPGASANSLQYFCYSFTVVTSAGAEVTTMPLSISGTTIYPDIFRLKAVTGTVTPPGSTAITATWQPHGAYMYPGTTIARGGKYFWVEPNQTVKLQIQCSSAFDTGLRVAFLKYSKTADFVAVDGTDNNITPTAATNNGNVSWSPNTPGYYRILIADVSSGSNVVSWSCAIIGNKDVYGHLTVPSFSDNLSSFEKIRINSASAMVSCRAPELTRSGSIQGRYVPSSDTQWYTEYTATTTLSSMQRQFNESYEFAKGMYSYLRPNNPSDLSFINCVSSNNGVVNSACFYLDDGKAYTMMWIIGGSAGTVTSGITTYSGLEFLLTVHFAIEFQTNNAIFETHTSPIMTKQYNDALDVLQNMPIFFENPLHWADIVAAAKSGYNGLRTFAPKIAKAFEGTLLGGFANAAAMLPEI